MDKETAEKIKRRGETAIRELTSILVLDQIERECSPDEYEAGRRAIGLAIGIIDTELLSIVYRQFPELDPID
ncbi:MAG: hypothetical protein ABL984_08490 [Pyrinomonadaceae bacterium]